MNRYRKYLSPLGVLCLVSSEYGLAGVYFDEHQHHSHDMRWLEDLNCPLLREAETQLGQYFSGQRNVFELPLDIAGGTAFQQKVWHALRTIPYGKTVSYGELAKQIGNPRAVRALGAANGRNPLSIIVPCHRVIATDGRLHGYAGGIQKKQYLLELENALFLKQ